MADVEVRDSSINAKGVFALREFKKGEVVILWADCSEKLSKTELERLSNEEKRYVSQVNQDTYILFKTPGKYVNHSCDPNTRAQGEADVAVRDIKKGEEITADYVSEGASDLTFVCTCGSKNCRKLLR